MATKQLTNNINSGFYPTYYNMPMLGFGDFLKSNAGTIGSLVGAGAGLLVGNPMLGAKVGGAVGGMVQAGDEKKQAEIAMQKQIEEQQKQLLLQQYNSGMLANGGLMDSYAGGGGLNFKSPAAYKAWLAYGHASGEFAKTPGHQKVSIKGQPKKVQHAMGGSLDNVTNYATGGFHETNPNGGIPLGDRALVEEGEVRYNSKKFGDYVFSNRF